jgi:hypothetical protein
VSYQAAAATLNLGGPTTFNSQVLTQINSNFPDGNWTGLLDTASGYPLMSSVELLIPLLTFPAGIPYTVYSYQQWMVSLATKYIVDMCRLVLLLPAFPTLFGF